MKRLSDFLTEDTNQFGPGTDLIISLMAVLLVMILISGHLYNTARKENQSFKEMYDTEKAKYAELKKLFEEEKRKNAAAMQGGNFKLASEYFSAADFYMRPVTKLVDPATTDERINKIVEEYDQSQNGFPYLFVIGHSNQVDDPDAADKSYSARLQRNWEYAGRRAAVIAALIQQKLADETKDKLVVVTAGEFDLKNPENPNSQENAWVEVVFGKDWKVPVRSAQN